MMVFAFIIGLTAILTGLEVPVLEAAAAAIGPGMQDWEKIAYMMVDNARDHSILYGINCFLDCAEPCTRCTQSSSSITSKLNLPH